MRFGLISLGGPSSKMIMEEAAKMFDVAEAIQIKNLEVNVSSDGYQVLDSGKPISEYDCIYVRGSYNYALLQRSISYALQDKCYMPLSPESFTLGHNKFLTMVHLQKIGVPIPKTYLAATTEGAKKLLKEVNYPVIMKIPSGTQGKGVMFADSVQSAKSILDTLEVFKQPYMIQEYIETGATDLRVIVVGDKVVAAMRRKATNEEIRANIHMGGVGHPVELDYETEQVAVKTAKALGCDICAVDILEGRKPYVIELNLSPGLQGIMKALKKNVPKMVADYLFKRTKEIKEDAGKLRAKKVASELELEKNNQLITNLDIKAGVLKVPTMMTKIAGFKPDEDVIFSAEKGKIKIERYNL